MTDRFTHPTRLRLRSGVILPTVRGVDLAPGSAFVLWQLMLGTAIVLIGAAGLVATRLRRGRLLRGVLVLRLVLLAVMVSARP